MRRAITILTALLLLVPLLVTGQTTTMQVSYTWPAPTTGSPVHHYEIQKSTDGGTTWTDVGTVTNNGATLTVPALQTLVVRVRAVDATGRSGPYSVASDPWTADPGPPGACGKPTRV